MDVVVLQLPKSNSGSTGTCSALAGAAGPLFIPPHILTVYLCYCAQGLSQKAYLLGELTAPLGAALYYG